ncbi:MULTISPECIES: hypothetical protein [unclassified Janthinobacterium]|uniref:hypothetical protein n=1 Tax=unclassified Janthinobacterium TaxID=2610881 RepID=UPI00160ED89F|nr:MULTISPECIES: hypothetical protein [unclassified Janthinobacterium]MBB5367918.1 hypothetical protein [Janthinobacterium sp. K2C7]MBB5379604.1 hypothetical protein [Janthinobacterium sp. K2Li3]MBB5386300.1 hypothetical protein [Janthinobacterium sp. K2E3]
MMNDAFDDSAQLRLEIASAAARLVAQDGADYGSAKRKAARQILGEQQGRPNLLPDDELIEQQLRQYNALFLADSQPARLFQLRTLALQVMEALEQFQPLLSGAVLNGTAGPHDEIYLQLFAESAKDIHIFLLNKNVLLDMSESPHFKGARYDAVETASFLWKNEGVHAAMYEIDDRRGALKVRADGKLLRTDIAGLRSLLASASTATE